MPNYASLPGFRDFYPSDLSIRAHIMSAWRTVARRYAFEEYDGPPLEPLELYTEKSGDEIVNQLYNFIDKGERNVALRPEMTPTLARMIGARAGALRKPIRWFSMPQLFRYERTQRGRLREHYQWNVDIVGEEDVAADVEVLAVAIDALRALGLDHSQIVARYNDRRLLERLLLHAGAPAEQLAATYNAVDKLGRESVEKVRARLVERAGLEPATADAVLRIFEHRELDAVAAAYGAVEGVAAEIARLRDYNTQLADLGLADYVAYDATIVRGLAYYTGIVFEIFDRKGELRAICGGGRYDNLLGQVGGVSLPAVGFGMGDVVLRELLSDHGLLPDASPALDYYIVAVSDGERPLQRRIARALRAGGANVGYALRTTGVGRQFKDADARGARVALVLGPDEVAAGVAILREMRGGEELRVPIAELLGGADPGGAADH
jgi:histidyl-tRNA synthetase